MNRQNIYGGFDYRTAYFKQNRGIFGYLYICSQCFKPMVNKQSIQVDHIIPPSRFARKRRSWTFKDTGERRGTLISSALNNTFNCVTICGPCNASKSNYMDHRILKGVVAKMLELSLRTTQLALTSTLWLSLNVLRLPFILPSRIFRIGASCRRTFRRIGSRGRRR